MLRGLLNKPWFIQFVPVYIAGFIAALFACVSVAQALEPIKPNPMSAGTFITESETCPNGVVGTDVFTTDEIDSNGGCDRAIPNPNLLIKSFAYKIKRLLKNLVLLYSPSSYANALDAGL